MPKRSSPQLGAGRLVRSSETGVAERPPTLIHLAGSRSSRRPRHGSTKASGSGPVVMAKALALVLWGRFAGAAGLTLVRSCQFGAARALTLADLDRLAGSEALTLVDSCQFGAANALT